MTINSSHYERRWDSSSGQQQKQQLWRQLHMLIILFTAAAVHFILWKHGHCAHCILITCCCCQQPIVQQQQQHGQSIRIHLPLPFLLSMSTSVNGRVLASLSLPNFQVLSQQDCRSEMHSLFLKVKVSCTSPERVSSSEQCNQSINQVVCSFLLSSLPQNVAHNCLLQSLLSAAL